MKTSKFFSILIFIFLSKIFLAAEPSGARHFKFTLDITKRNFLDKTSILNHKLEPGAINSLWRKTVSGYGQIFPNWKKAKKKKLGRGLLVLALDDFFIPAKGEGEGYFSVVDAGFVLGEVKAFLKAAFTSGMQILLVAEGIYPLEDVKSFFHENFNFDSSDFERKFDIILGSPLSFRGFNRFRELRKSFHINPEEEGEASLLERTISFVGRDVFDWVNLNEKWSLRLVAFFSKSSFHLRSSEKDFSEKEGLNEGGVHFFNTTDKREWKRALDLLFVEKRGKSSSFRLRSPSTLSTSLLGNIYTSLSALNGEEKPKKNWFLRFWSSICCSTEEVR